METCRICLTRGIRMHFVINTYLQEIYEHLTSVPFQREDGRPLLICCICKARLKNCHEMRLNCLRSEEYFTDLLNNHLKPTPLRYMNSFQIEHSTTRMNNVSVDKKFGDDDPNIDPLDISDFEVKKESIEAKDDNTIDESILNTEPEHMIKTEEFSTDYNDTVCSVEANDNIEYELMTDERSLDVSVKPGYNDQDADEDVFNSSTGINMGDDTSAPIDAKSKPPIVKENDTSTTSRSPEIKVRLTTSKNIKKLQHVKEPHGPIDVKAELPVVKESYSMSTSRSPEIEVRLAPNKTAKKKQPMKITEDINENIDENISAIGTNIMDTSGELQNCVKTSKDDNTIDESVLNTEPEHMIKTEEFSTDYNDTVCSVEANDNIEYELMTDERSLDVSVKPDYNDQDADEDVSCSSTEINMGDDASGSIDVKAESPVVKESDSSTTSRSPEVKVRLKPNKNVKKLQHVKEPIEVINKNIDNIPTIATEIMNVSGDLQTSVKTYKCDVCDKCFSQRSTLVLHIRIHTGEKLYRCVTCEKCFSHKSHFVSHSRIHTGEKPYRCDICNKHFSQNKTLSKHILRVHTDKKPYSCATPEICLNDKTKVTKAHTEEKPYRCVVCDKCFSRQRYLVLHTRLHTGEKLYKCGTCEKCFSHKSNFVSHIRIHSGEKPHKCNICDKCFCQRGTVLRHILMRHTHEKPYKCDACEKYFSAKSDLVSHCRTHIFNLN